MNESSKIIRPPGMEEAKPDAGAMTTAELAKSILEKGRAVMSAAREMRNIAIATRERGAAPAGLVARFMQDLSDYMAIFSLAQQRSLGHGITTGAVTNHRLMAVISLLEKKGILTAEEVDTEAKVILASLIAKAKEREGADTKPSEKVPEPAAAQAP